MQFKSDDLVWTVKQRVLATCGHELKDSLNYGLYVPSSKIKAGKFLDEERPLLDYPFASPVGQLEVQNIGSNVFLYLGFYCVNRDTFSKRSF